jgi:hypothetical protein
MTLFIILAILLLILGVILFTPVRLIVNSYKGIYSAQFGSLAQIFVRPDFEQYRLGILVKALFYKKEFYPLEEESGSKKEKKKKEKKPEKKKEKKKKKFDFMKQVRKSNEYLNVFKSLLNSFKIRKFFAEFDTGSPAANGMIYSLYGIKSIRENIAVNFEGRYGLIFHIENNIFNFLKHGIKFFFIYKFKR